MDARDVLRAGLQTAPWITVVLEARLRHDDTGARHKASRIGVGKAFASPPSEPDWRFSRIRLSSRWFLHRDCLATVQAV